jgi:hypothetical protein
MSCDLYITSDQNNICYDATSVFYVSLHKMRECFQFSTSDISNGSLNSSVLDNIHADIKYLLDISYAPYVNPAHSTMNTPFSQTAIIDISNTFLKQDMLRYIGKSIFNTVHLTGLLSNKLEILNDIERKGWNHRNVIYQLFNQNDVLTNHDISNNLCRTIMKQIFDNTPERFLDPCMNAIIDTDEKQSVPLFEGDTINFFFTLVPPLYQTYIVKQYNRTIKERKYRILLYLTDDTTKINDIPNYSLADIPNSGISDRGLP